jgi:hypothetical protein
MPAGIVHQEVELIALPLCLRDFFEFFDKTIKGLAFGNVERKRRGFPAGLFDLFHNVFGVCLFAVVGQDDIISLGGDMQGHALAQTAASAGYECASVCFSISSRIAPTFALRSSKDVVPRRERRPSCCHGPLQAVSIYIWDCG